MIIIVEFAVTVLSSTLFFKCFLMVDCPFNEGMLCCTFRQQVKKYDRKATRSSLLTII